MKKVFFAIIAVVVLATLAVVVFYYSERGALAEIRSFQDCIDHGFQVRESHPRQCQTPDGRNFVEIISEEDHREIRVFRPEMNEEIEGSVVILGEARGSWFFEGSFPLELLDGEGNSVPIDPPFIEASEDWMTDQFVPFSSQISFSQPTTDEGVLIFRKSNPSDLPEQDDSIEIPVIFSQTEVTNVDGGDGETLGECRVTGCSGEVCSNQEVATSCIWLEEFACYQGAVCERQDDGQCGWTETSELVSCLAELST